MGMEKFLQVVDMLIVILVYVNTLLEPCSSVCMGFVLEDEYVRLGTWRSSQPFTEQTKMYISLYLFVIIIILGSMVHLHIVH